ncbi:protein-histidine N-methyltransferase [Aspergillus saccharolyticus JOP 1030-1]|uniref:protein-histidine N-methyltransferase n=1 Tax=Aspergillus saccharolyticus JOP 1030-1 TaxID=1450539 RepID=A0A318ZRT0_9EURO|nr:hypothetical protein BP01DRAFT_422607 [Aspergillus saccharolyticus JOP 1030-1]PYH46660.1 hypothetical protein BP01DRAFT_422607 [Aspergillus saccharolyticus JOP 1030-1]
MTSTFSFGFAGDDIDIDDTEVSDVNQADFTFRRGVSDALPELVPARRHHMSEWITSLPSQISYNEVAIPTSQQGGAGKPVTLARRDVYDIRTQLMAEDTAEDSEENYELIAGLEKGDIKPNFYEGGFKTWECALDLAKLLLDTNALTETSGARHFIELGAGTAVPSLALFAQLLSMEPNPQRRVHFTFGDYNAAVLRLVTFPNLLLTWNHIVSNVEGTPCKEEATEDELLDISTELVERFQRDLERRGITVDFVSGAWSPEFVNLVFSSDKESRSDALVLASETIYSPASLQAFSDTLLALLRRPVQEGVSSKALIAAKKVYFGVGGGVDEFLAVMGDISGSNLTVQERVDIKSEGVGRVILEIILA